MRVTGANLAEPRMIELSIGHAACFTRAMPGKNTNEDSLGVAELEDGTVILAVADGVGSTMRAADASAIAVDTICALGDSNRTYSTESVMQAVDTAHRRIAALACGSATTLVVGVVTKEGVRAFNTGDSGMLVTGRNGRRKLRTTFHSPLGYAEEAGIMSTQEALEHAERHYVSNVLGASPMSVEVSEVHPLARFDTIVLASDGVWDNLPAEEVIETVRRGPLIDAADELRTFVDERMASGSPATKADDVAFVLFRRAARG